jgi:hypothetical protein
MTVSNPDDTGGEQPDTFDGRLAGIIRLIDTFDDETIEGRREHRRLVIVRLLAAVLNEAVTKVGVELDRVSGL